MPSLLSLLGDPPGACAGDFSLLCVTQKVHVPNICALGILVKLTLIQVLGAVCNYQVSGFCGSKFKVPDPKT